MLFLATGNLYFPVALKISVNVLEKGSEIYFVQYILTLNNFNDDRIRNYIINYIFPVINHVLHERHSLEMKHKENFNFENFWQTYYFCVAIEYKCFT